MAKRASSTSSLTLVALAVASLLAWQAFGPDGSLKAHSPAAAATTATGSGAVGLSVPGTASSGVSLAVAGQQVVVTWAASTGSSTDIYAAVSGDEGASFGSPQRVNDVLGDARVNGEQAPRVAIGGRDIEVVWLSKGGGSSRVRAATSTDGGRSFGRATTVHAEGLPGARGWQSLSVDGDRARHVAWLDGRGARAERAAGSESHAKHGSMRQDLFQAVWRADGTHDEVAVATDVCFCCKTAIANAPDGATYVAWRHIYPTNQRDIAVARSVDGGRTFAAPVRVSEDGWQIDGCPDDGPSAAVDASGVLHIVWPTLIRGDAPAKAIFYSSSADGGRTFAPRVRVDEAKSGAAHPQIAVSSKRVAVVWDQGGPERGVYLREILRDATPGSKPALMAILPLSADRPAIYPAVAATPGSIVAAWTEKLTGTSEVRVRRVTTMPPSPAR